MGAPERQNGTEKIMAEDVPYLEKHRNLENQQSQEVKTI